MQQFAQKVSGIFEVDESYFGRSRIRGSVGPKKKGRATHKQPVFGVYERGGRVYTEIVPDVTKHTLIGIIRGRISLESVIHSDKWRAYDGLVDVGYEKHFRVNHSKEYANKKCHINGIESFWSFTKRRLEKFNGVKVNFDLHLKECEWRHKKTILQMKQELSNILKRS
jgi:transposase-like protein